MTITIRRATWRDHPKLWPLRYALHVEENAISGRTPIENSDSLKAMAWALDGELMDPMSIFVSAWDGDDAIGYISLRPVKFYGYDDSATLGCTGLYVKPEHRMGAVGFRMIREGMRCVKPFGRLQMVVANGNDPVAVPLLMHGAKVMATVYELEFDNGRGNRRTSEGSAVHEEGSRGTGGCLRQSPGEPAVHRPCLWHAAATR